MKITDTTGRQMTVDVYTNVNGQMMPALDFKLRDSSKIYLAIEQGSIAIKTHSQHPLEIMALSQGKLIVAPQLMGKGSHLIGHEDAQYQLTFDNGAIMAANSGALTEEHKQIEDGLRGQVISAHNVVTVIARFAREATNVHQPPSQEYRVTFELNQLEKHLEILANNFHKVVQPDDFVDPDSDPNDKAPKFVMHCTCTGCSHKH